MNTIVERYNKIQLNIAALKPVKPVNIIAVSKTFSYDHIKPLVDYAQIHLEKKKNFRKFCFQPILLKKRLIRRNKVDR